MIALELLSIPVSLFLIYLGASRTLKGALGLSTLIKIRKTSTGAVIIASITTLPELFSSVTATILGSSHLALGNILGSNIYNLPLLIGLAGILGEFEINNEMAEQCLLLVALNILVAVVSATTSSISPAFSVFLLGCYLFFLYRQLHKGMGSEKVASGDRDFTQALIIGSGALLIGSFILVHSALEVIHVYAVSPFFVGLLMSLGSVLPEVAVSLLSALKGEHEVSVSNIIGDNVITITLVLGLVSLLRPMSVTASEVLSTIPYTLLFTAVIYLIHVKGWKVTRKTAILFLVSIVTILVYQMVSA